MKKILPLLFFTLMSTQAQVLDAIAIDVEGEAITTLEIQAVQQKMNISKQATVEALIKDRLEKSAIEKAGIRIEDSAIQAKINAIAAAKGLSQSQMKEILQKKGLSWESYIQQLTTGMKKERFFQEHILATIERPSDSELETFYQTHRSDFSDAPKQMSFIAYKSNSVQQLKESIANPMKVVGGVKKESILASSNEMSPELLNLINATEINSFTKPVQTQKGFVSYFIKSKGNGQSGFAAVKNAVAAQWAQGQRVQAAKDFFNKLKANANIRVIRL